VAVFDVLDEAPGGGELGRAQGAPEVGRF
jgi:hypothetical protein